MAEEDVIEFKAESERIKKLPAMLQSLVGVEGVHVLIGELKEDAKSTGLTKEQLKTDAELRLRHDGIKVNSEEECLASMDKAIVGVNVDTFSYDGSSGIVCDVSVMFSQVMLILRRPHHGMVSGTTWERSDVGVCSTSKFQEAVRDTVAGQMDEFINDYFTANPKK